MITKNDYAKDGVALRIYEIKNDLPPLFLLHAQGVDGLSFSDVMPALAKKYHVYSVDCYGHGGSLHDPATYNVEIIGKALEQFIETIGEKVYLLGHSSGGLLAAYLAANTQLVKYLILEDPPFFASQGERRKKTFNYVDLANICHQFLQQTEEEDFVLYYFKNHYAWNFFPEKSREKVRSKLIKLAEKRRRKHPDENLKVPFWPKAALSGFQGMNNYDANFGECFYNDSFHNGIDHAEILQIIQCPTLFMKAKTDYTEDGILLAALNEDDLANVQRLIPTCQVHRFECGHGIHIEKGKQFVGCLLTIAE